MGLELLEQLAELGTVCERESKENIYLTHNGNNLDPCYIL